MVWSGISVDHKTPLVCIDDSLTAQRYIDNILQPVVLPFLHQYDDVITFLQDNTRPHSAGISMEYLYNVNVMPWPAYSPDLSQIEYLWNVMKTRLNRENKRENKRPNRAELIASVQEEWEAIPLMQTQTVDLHYVTHNGRHV